MIIIRYIFEDNNVIENEEEEYSHILSVADICKYTTRIIIRTGQPGNFPEYEVIEKFDIDGFAEKTDLRSDKLHTIIYSALRSYRDISIISKCKTKLENFFKSMSRLIMSAPLSLYTYIEESAQKKQGILNNTFSVSYHALKNNESLHLCFEPDENLFDAGKKILSSLSDAIYLIYLAFEKENSPSSE